jgi:hypothetical protein
MKKNLLKITIFNILMLSLSFSANAQDLIRLKESIGMPLLARRYVDIQGSPYFIRDWSKATVKLANELTYTELEVRYDEVSDVPVFKNEQGGEMGFKLPVAEFVITYNLDGARKTSLFRNGFKAISGFRTEAYFEVLYDGPVKLLKKNSKYIQDYKAYNSATTTRMIKDKINYFVASDTDIKELKRDRKAFQMIFKDKTELVLKYINENKLDLKDDGDLIKVFSYYSTIH